MELSRPGLGIVRVRRGPVSQCGSCTECTVAPFIGDENLKADLGKHYAKVL